mmetsp:Transcript_6087/g.9519  ORF Transcript_6087/g.9519 Transcript_6087/m.9519 type:complete len:204 (+) Transcript_6087:69-680(+)
MTTHPSLKVTYFDVKARAEPIRLALAVGKIEFEDERLAREAFIKRKPDLPFGSLPTMNIGEKQFAQSNALLRYAGKLAGLYPSDALEALKVDQILDAAEDTLGALRPSFSAKDEEKKLSMRKEFMENAFPRYVSGIESLVEGKWAVGDKMTIADLVLYQLKDTFTSGFLDGIPKNAFDEYSKISSVADAVGLNAEVKAWNDSH